ncbi:MULTISPECIES: hypothetical protein [Paenibacillus]|uniref:Trigger factor n=1 Tax=Paenibacillus pabuli TaxID=1472 RepID=A0A855XPU0_9BACL|nr:MULTISPECIES: hypothetical protein [Paenibacillus]PWW32700.1 hypothetical protein DET56_12450 [Paenibacillus pabuli]PXV98351.1 hypothetical protein DEU73_12214 [Paenibacillus taichungensis]
MLKSKLIKLANYKDMEITDDVRGEPLNEIEVEGYLDKLAKRNVVTTEVEKIESGDFAVLNLKSEHEKFNRKNLKLTVGLGMFNSELETQVVGMSRGEVKTLNVHGHDVLVDVKGVQRRSLAEVSNDIISSLNIKGVTTVSEYKAHLINKDLKEKRTSAICQNIVDFVLNNSEFEISDEDSSYLYQLQLNAYELFSRRENVSLEELVNQYYGKSVDEFKKSLMIGTPNSIKYILLFLEYNKEDQNLQSIQAQYEEQIKEDSAMHGISIEEAKESHPYDFFIVSRYKGMVLVKWFNYAEERVREAEFA